MEMANNNLGCGERFYINKTLMFICGVPNGNGVESFCQECKKKMKDKWDKEDRESKDPRIREIYKLRKAGKLNY